jgi:putative phosphotransacetylase
MGYKAAVGLSNKHLHLKAEDVETLFGKGHTLTPQRTSNSRGSLPRGEVDIDGRREP